MKNSSALESVCSYGDMVRASSPVRDVEVEQENIDALDAVNNLAISTSNVNVLAEKVVDTRERYLPHGEREQRDH